MDLATLYQILCIALGLAIFVMGAGLVAIVLTIYEKVMQINEHNSRD